MISKLFRNLTDEITDLEEEDLLNLLNHIPEGCKTILIFSLSKVTKKLQLYAEHFEGTSKSQLNASKTKLKELVNNCITKSEIVMDNQEKYPKNKKCFQKSRRKTFLQWKSLE
jgi:hypothetical protein